MTQSVETSRPSRMRRKALRALSIVLLAIAGSLLAVRACSAGLELPGLVGRTIRIGNVERSYLLYRPRAGRAKDQQRPLVFLLHGGGGTARQIASDAGRSLMAIAEREGFYVVIPNAVDKMWDFGLGTVSEKLPKRADDRAFLKALLDTLPTQMPIDKRRIFATGISRGGQASWFMACSFPGQIRAIAPVAMPMPQFLQHLCAKAPPYGAAIINGTADPLVPYEGGFIRIGRKKRDAVLSTAATAALLRERNRCDRRPPETELIDPVDDGMKVEKSTWQDCHGAPVIVYRIVGGGHTWPSVENGLPVWLVGKVNRDIDGATEIWRFFAGFE